MTYKKILKAIHNPTQAGRYILNKFVFQKNSSYKEWVQRDFSAPSPHFIKHAVLLRNGFKDATWVETGTYTGDTTEVLSNVGKKVFSIEPEPELFQKAQQRFKLKENVEIINGMSENVFPTLLSKLNGAVCFWLDGHYSEGVTYQGPQDTPIIDELNCIEAHLTRMGNVVIMIDDVRCFDPHNPVYSTYPTIDFLVDWARKNDLMWHIEHDIFVARTH